MDEHFSPLRIDNTPSAIEGWDGKIPYLDSWKRDLNYNALTPHQKQFYDFLRKSIEEGHKVINGQIRQYLNILINELTAKKRNIYDKPYRLKMARNIINLYSSSYAVMDLGDMLKNEAARLAALRINKYKRQNPARWIPLGEECDAEGHHFTRGGFYLGPYLEYARYLCRSSSFSNSKNAIEGPVINLDKPGLDLYNPDYLCKEYSTYLEMGEGLKKNLLAWLEGAETCDVDILRYYLAGIEFRLLCDPQTTKEERIGLIHYLIKLSTEFNISSYYIHKLREDINSLIGCVLARFFVDEIKTHFPSVDPFSYPFVKRAKLIKGLVDSKVDTHDNDAVISTAVECLGVPAWLDEVFVPAFIKNIKTEISFNLTHRITAYVDGLKYYSLGPKILYKPNPDYIYDLEQEPYKNNIINSKVINKVLDAYNSTLYLLREYKSRKLAGASVLSLMRVLPPWCDPKLLPSIKDALAEITPTGDERFKLLKLENLTKILGQYCIETLTANELLSIDTDLSRYGLKLGCPISSNIKLKDQDMIAVYNASCGDVPSRGTLPSGLFIIAWFLSAETVSDHALDIVDNWLIERAGKVEKAIPAIAYLRLLVYRRLTMSAKRKVKAATYKKFIKQRSELIDLLLTLYSDLEICTPKRMTRLESIYTLVGLDPATIHSDLHRRATTPTTGSKANVSKATKAPTAIDRRKLKDIEQSTKKAQAILHDVFAQEEVQPQSPTKTKTDDKGGENPTIVILKLLTKKSEWSRADFEALAHKHGETAGSLLERLNDYAYDTVEEPVAEDDDQTVYIDLDVAKNIIENGKEY